MGTPAAEADPVRTMPTRTRDHADEDDEVSCVLTQRETRDPWLGDVRDEVVLDEIEEQAEGHDRDPETGKHREWRACRQQRAGGERRDRERIDQSAYLRSVSIANVGYC